MNSARIYLAATFVLFAFAGGALFMYQAFQGGRTPPEYATVWPTPLPIPDFELTDQSGQPFSRDSLRDRWSLLFFGFTHCPDICPATLQQLAIARSRIEDAGHDTPDIVLVSVDPERDTPDVLAPYVRHFGAEVKGVTGDLTELRKLTSTAGIYFEKSSQADGSYGVDHSVVVLVIDKDAAIHASFGAPHDIDRFVHDLPIIMGSN